MTQGQARNLLFNDFKNLSPFQPLRRSFLPVRVAGLLQSFQRILVIVFAAPRREARQQRHPERAHLLAPEPVADRVLTARPGTLFGSVLLACAAATVFVLLGTAGQTVYAFHRLFVADLMSHVLKLAACGAVSATLVIGTAPKLAAFAMAMRLLVNGMLHLAVDWQQMLVILAVLSMALGNITAIAQTNLKRMLAYSTIAHMGFMLLGLLSGVVGGNWLNAADAYAAAMFYTLVYVLMALGSFGVLVFLSHKGFECEKLEDLRGLNRRNPWYAFMVLLLMFSLAGVPPTVGFYAKLAVLSAAVNAGQIWLAVVAVLFSLIGAYYYLRIVKLMYFDEPKDETPFSGQALGPRILLSANGLALLALGILPQPLMSLCFIAIKSL